MLRRLEVESYGLIARAEVEFADGATIFTGETGSGKTMLLGALDFALGARAGPDVVRRGARRAQVTLVFDPDEAMRERLASDGYELDPGEAGTIVREMNDAARSNVRVNGRPSTAGYVRDLGDAIAEIVGQHEAQRLLSPAYHLELLDRFAGPAALRLRDEVAGAYARAREAADELARLSQDERHARERYEDASFAVREIEEARLDPSEGKRLDERRRYLDNVERIALALRAAHDALAGQDHNAAEATGSAAAALSSIAAIDDELREMAERAGALQAQAGDLALDLARALDATEFDPGELDAINARLDVLDRLKRKYGGSLEEALGYAQRARQTIEEYENRDRCVAEASAKAATAEGELKKAAASLSAKRKDAGAGLGKRVRAVFREIALASGRFEAAFEPLDQPSARGGERVEFLFAANVGEEARPLARVASGGELSRVLLALVVVLSGARGPSGALVFDEIDAGLGGAAATAVGARIGELARSGQVICVTHVAALATWADRHYILDKIERKGETTIAVREIRGAREREAEIARMLSGETHDVALRHARALLGR